MRTRIQKSEGESRTGQMHAEQAQALGISTDLLVSLALCRMSRDAEEVRQIAAQIGVGTDRLAEVLDSRTD